MAARIIGRAVTTDAILGGRAKNMAQAWRVFGRAALLSSMQTKAYKMPRFIREPSAVYHGTT